MIITNATERDFDRTIFRISKSDHRIWIEVGTPNLQKLCTPGFCILVCATVSLYWKLLESRRVNKTTKENTTNTDRIISPCPAIADRSFCIWARILHQVNKCGFACALSLPEVSYHQWVSSIPQPIKTQQILTKTFQFPGWPQILHLFN